MLRAEDVKIYIAQGLSCDYLEVNGDDGQHFEAIVVSKDFIGKNIVQQHQMVYKALGERMKDEIHALSMKTYTPDSWSKK